MKRGRSEVKLSMYYSNTENNLDYYEPECYAERRTVAPEPFYKPCGYEKSEYDQGYDVCGNPVSEVVQDHAGELGGYPVPEARWKVRAC